MHKLEIRIDPFPLIQREADIETERAEKGEIAEASPDRFEPFCGKVRVLGKGNGAEIGEGDDADRLCHFPSDLRSRIDGRASPEGLSIVIQRADSFIAVSSQFVF